MWPDFNQSPPSTHICGLINEHQIEDTQDKYDSRLRIKRGNRLKAKIYYTSFPVTSP